MNGGRGFGKFGSIEFSFLQLAGLGLASWKMPVLCNGANLLFNRSQFLQVDIERTDYNVSSGDDIFLLSKFIEKKFCIRVATAKQFSVSTPAPEGITELLSQRRRWIDKVGRMSFPSLLLGVAVIPFSQAAMIASLLFSIAFPIFLIPVAMKFFIELLVDLVIVKKISVSRILLLLIHQLWYPVYMVLLLLPVESGRWKTTVVAETKSDEEN